jgi:hypothetical protein
MWLLDFNETDNSVSNSQSVELQKIQKGATG